MNDALPWLQLLLVPIVGLLMQIQSSLATLTARQADHARRLDNLERHA